MSGMSFGAGAEARRRIGNVFLALAEVKRAMSGCQRSQDMYPIDYGNRLPSINGKHIPLKIDLFTFPDC
jgi:hypothetical protein